MNFKKMAEQIELDEKDFLELVGIFLSSARKDLLALNAAMDKKDFRTVAEMAHSIKGAAINLGFENLHELSRAMEIMARQDSPLEGHEMAESLNQMLQQVEDAYEKRVVFF